MIAAKFILSKKKYRYTTEISLVQKDIVLV
jgi:hypothetical protein